MVIKLATAFVLLLCVGGLGLASTIAQFAMVDAVNEKLPKSEQFDPFWWYPPKTVKLFLAYRRLYPTGRLLRRQVILGTTMLVCLLLTALLMLQFK
jgi:hypothetical protein